MIEEHRDVMMENYQEKYKKELHQQEINSNIHTLKGFFWIFVTILLLWMLTLVRIFIVDSRIFTMAAGVSAVMGITVLYELLKEDMNDKTKLELVRSFDEVLSLNLTSGAAEETDTVSEEMEAYILEKIEERKAAKKEKNFEKADAIRNELLEKGIVLEDTREGVKWKRV